MVQDRFDQFYMLQTRAKDLEKKKRSSEALEIYTEIIEDYFPDTDYSFSRAVTLLREKGNLEQAKQYSRLAIERINAGEMKGDYTFFNAVLKELEQTEKKDKLHININFNSFLNRRSLIALFYFLIALMLSYPFKWSKFAFIIFIGISLLLIIEIIKRIKHNLKVTLQSIALLLAGFITISSAAMIPRPEWASFFSLEPLSQIGRNKIIDAPSGAVVGEDEDLTISKLSKEDLSTLESVYQTNLIIDGYEIWFEGDIIFLTIFAKKSASNEEIKTEAFNILKELNSIKGMKNYEDRLGDLYKQYDAKIAVYDEAGNEKFNGISSRHTLKIKW